MSIKDSRSPQDKYLVGIILYTNKNGQLSRVVFPEDLNMQDISKEISQEVIIPSDQSIYGYDGEYRKSDGAITKITFHHKYGSGK